MLLIRNNTWYNIGDTKDANDAETINKIPKKKWFSRDKSKWFACQIKELRDGTNGNSSLSYKDFEERDRAGNLKTGRFAVNMVAV